MQMISSLWKLPWHGVITQLAVWTVYPLSRVSVLYVMNEIGPHEV